MVRHDYFIQSMIESSSTNAPSYVRAGGVHGGACGQAFPSEKLRKEVTTLGVTLFVLSLGLSQLVTGLMLETDGRNVVQHSFSQFSYTFPLRSHIIYVCVSCTFPILYARCADIIG